MFMHRQENIHSFISFPSGDIPLSDDSECLRVRAKPPRLHSGHKFPHSLVIAHPSSDVNGVIEGYGGVSIRTVVIEEVEKLEGFRAVVPQTL